MTATLRFYQLAAVLVAAIVFPSATSSAQTLEAKHPASVALDVMTFNIRTAIGRDGNNSWPFRKELVLETILESDPDIVGLQEALAEQIKFLESKMPEYRWIGVDRGLNGGKGLSEATPIFYKYQEMVPIESGTFWLSDDPNPPTRQRRVSRIVTWARFHLLETRQQIYVYNTHFTLRRGPRQLQSASQINAHIADLPPGSAVVVMGDFNAVAETSETWRVATAEGLRDAWVVAEHREGPPLTGNGFRAPREGWEGRIDWLLVGGPVSVERIETVVNSSDGRYPSDHYPVVASLLFELP